MTESINMKYLLVLLFLTGCSVEVPKQLSADKVLAAKAEKARYEAGPKFSAGCYKVINKDSRLYGCTFFSRQGSMFVSDDQSTSSNSGVWALAWNRKIRCLTDADFVYERDVKAINCPNFLYE